MNPFDLDATDLMIWGLVAHLIADWPLQNDWMANNKMKRLTRKSYQRDPLFNPHHPIANPERWWLRHPAAYVHASIHGFLLAFVFGWIAIPLALAHLIIDCRWVVVKWSKFIGQTQPNPMKIPAYKLILVDVGTEVRFWTDQVFHIATIAIAALIVGSL